MRINRKSFVFFCLTLILITPVLAAKPKPKVHIKKLKNGHYQLIVEKKPYYIKGACYNPIPLGENHWYDWWSDPGKPWIVDGKLMKDMGINTIRIYQAGENPQDVKIVIRDLYEKYGIRVALGHWLGFWEYPCPLYGNKAFQERIKKEVLEMVAAYKDEPGVLCWILGNENNYSCMGRVNPWSTDEIDKERDLRTQQFMRGKIYYSYINEIAKEIHKIDPDHPVALGNGELVGLDAASQFCPDIDMIACIIYRGKTFGNLFRSAKAAFDRPVIIAEFGADSYDACSGKEDQNTQAFFLESQWRQIHENAAGNREGAGNCLGGFIFEWTDEWWKHDPDDPQGWATHHTEAGWSNGSYYFDIKAKDNKNMNEEWFGIVALSQELESGLNKRVPKKSYYVLREFWKNPTFGINKQKKARSKK